MSRQGGVYFCILSCFVDLVPIHDTRGKLTCLRKSPHSPAPFLLFFVYFVFGVPE